MEFDSDELDDLVLDWEDITAFRTPSEMTYVFDGQLIYTGSASMRDGMIRINTVDGVRELPRRDLLSIIESNTREWNFWSVKASVGYTQRAGNTEQVDLSVSANVKREATRSRLSLEYRGDLSETQGAETANNHKASGMIDLFISRKLYITAVSYEYYSDKFQNINHRNTVGAGMGYFIFRRSKVDWSIGIGGGYQVTEFLSQEEGEDSSEKTGSVIPTIDLDWDITKNIEWELEYSSRLGVPDIKTSIHHAATTISIDFYKDIFELKFSVNWERVDNPKAFEDGSVPKKNDIKTIFGFGIDL
jgi:putative salt-induced outer membrane protein YdiY